MPFPAIQSAIPKRRYQYGEFSITLLSDVSSNDPINYLYIVAVLREGASKPEVYITCEPITLNNTHAFRIRALSEQDEYIISENTQWHNEQLFCDFAMQGIKQMFELSDENPILLS